jgi:Nucleotidyl transferase AbiEii toxin, Type IV TA system
MYAAHPDRWVLKGGLALILRLDPNRTSNDIDVTYVHRAGEHAVALRALERAVDVDLADFFSFEIIRVGPETDDRARRVSTLCRLGVPEFARFSSRPCRVSAGCSGRAGGGAAAVGRRGDRQPPAPPRPRLAEPDRRKSVRDLRVARSRSLIACTGPRRSWNGRRQVDGLSGDALIDALRAEESRRRRRSLPYGLPDSFVLPQAQEREWRATFEKASRGAPISFDEALALSEALIDPLLNGSAAGKTWNQVARTYE